jgi:hypothetical protein
VIEFTPGPVAGSRVSARAEVHEFTLQASLDLVWTSTHRSDGELPPKELFGQPPLDHQVTRTNQGLDLTEAERKKMPSLRKILALVLSAAPLASTNVLGFGTTERIEVPVQQLTLPDGMIRYSVPVSTGGNAPIEAMLDTGSFGLRVLNRALSSNEYTPTQIQRIYRFGSGVRLHGIIAG